MPRRAISSGASAAPTEARAACVSADSLRKPAA
ncbi:MAG: hypothetical protein AVDCRST_MAG88-3981, partial [uncultured Thermomicrobiales bacterium]